LILALFNFMYFQKHMLLYAPSVSCAEIHVDLMCTFYYLFSIILESDPILVAQRVAFRSDDIPLGEQTVASVRFVLLYCLITSLRFLCRVL